MISLPKDEEEQRAIATALSDADDWIASLDRLIAKKRDIKQAAMQQLLTGKTRLPGFQKKPGYKQSEIGVIPEDWGAEAMGDYSLCPLGGDFDPCTSSIYQDAQHPYPIYSNALTSTGLYGFTPDAIHKGNSITVTARGVLGSANYRGKPFTAIGRVL